MLDLVVCARAGASLLHLLHEVLVVAPGLPALAALGVVQQLLERRGESGQHHRLEPLGESAVHNQVTFATRAPTKKKIKEQKARGTNTSKKSMQELQGLMDFSQIHAIDKPNGHMLNNRRVQ